MRFRDWAAEVHIVTKRFLLRDFVEDDGSAFLAYHANPHSRELYGPQETEPGHIRHLLELKGTM